MADEVVIRAPGRDKPGYLRRLRKAMELQERTRGRLQVAADVDDLVAFVLAEAEITAPPGTDVTEALYDLSKAQWDALLRATTLGPGQEGAEVSGATVDPQKGG